MRLLMSVCEESHKWDGGFSIYTPVAQQLSLLYTFLHEVRVSYHV